MTPASAAAALDELDLPPTVREALELCDVAIWDRVPGPELEPLGLRPDLAGALVVPDDPPLDDEADPARSLILLFLPNIKPATPEEVQATFLHEVAHLVGFEEEEIEAMGLARP